MASDTVACVKAIVEKAERATIGGIVVTRLTSSCEILILVIVAAVCVGCAGDDGDESAGVIVGFRGEGPEPDAFTGGFLRLGDDGESTGLPAICRPEKYEKAFLHGAQKGRHRVDLMWKKYDSCGQLEEFVDEFVTNIDDLSPDADDNRTQRYCRYSGQLEGTFQALEVIQLQCESQCFLDGDLVGRIEAKSYCDLAIDAAGDLDPVQWIRRPVGICGFAFELGCDVSFLGSTLAYENDRGACEPYTRAPFEESWVRFGAESCDYYQRR